VFSGLLLVGKDGEPVVYRPAAWRTVQQAETSFNIGSLGKMFSTVAIA
jgi:hypothetical protein